MANQFIANVKGVGVKEIYKEYYASSSAESLADGEWSKFVPSIEASQYLWSRWKVVLTNGEITYTEGIQEGIAGADLSNLQKLVDDLKKTVGSLGDVAKENVVPIEKGGHGGTSVLEARTNLGLGTVATRNIVPCEEGGTGLNVATVEELILALGGNIKTLIWENPNPAVAFETDFVEKDLSDCDEVEIEYRWSTSRDVTQRERVKMGASTALKMQGNIASDGSYMRLYQRLASVDTTGITFEDAYSKQTNQADSLGVSNGYCIPIRIYKIKGIKSAI